MLHVKTPKLLRSLPWRWQNFLFGTEFSFHFPGLGMGIGPGIESPLTGGAYYRVTAVQPPILEPGQRYTLRDLLPIRWTPDLEGCIADADLRVGKCRVVTDKPPETWAGYTAGELLLKVDQDEEALIITANKLARYGHTIDR